MHIILYNWYTIGLLFSVLSYLKKKYLYFLTNTADRDQTVSQRSEPSARTTLISEQLNPWYQLQHQDVMSRHRGAKPLRRYGLLRVISLLSPEYLLSVVR